MSMRMHLEEFQRTAKCIVDGCDDVADVWLDPVYAGIAVTNIDAIHECIEADDSLGRALRQLLQLSAYEPSTLRTNRIMTGDVDILNMDRKQRLALLLSAGSKRFRLRAARNLGEIAETLVENCESILAERIYYSREDVRLIGVTCSKRCCIRRRNATYRNLIIYFRSIWFSGELAADPFPSDHQTAVERMNSIVLTALRTRNDEILQLVLRLDGVSTCLQQFDLEKLGMSIGANSFEKGLDLIRDDMNSRMAAALVRGLSDRLQELLSAPDTSSKLVILRNEERSAVRKFVLRIIGITECLEAIVQNAILDQEGPSSSILHICELLGMGTITEAVFVSSTFYSVGCSLALSSKKFRTGFEFLHSALRRRSKYVSGAVQRY